MIAEIAQLRNLPPGGWPRTAHLIGLGGAGLRALAELLHDQGCRVTGSDAAPSPAITRALAPLGIQISVGHAPEHIPTDCERVIYSAAIPPENSERIAAAARNIPQSSYPQFLGELTRHSDAVCIAGTHGKSTTTALVGSILTEHHAATQVVCGAEVIARGRAGWGGAGPQLVVESCEFRRHFLQLVPHALAITGIEWDHVDCFGSLSDTVDAFASLLRRVREDGVVVYRTDCRASRRAIVAARMDRLCTGPRIVSCGIAADADWRIVSRLSRPGGSVVELCSPEDEPIRLTVPLPGEHNAANAVVAAVAALELGVPPDTVTAAIQRFAGTRRRLQYLGEWRGMTLWDDYAHHPTAVRAVLTTVRELFPTRRLVVAFEPHQVQRTEVFRDGFAAALKMADQAWVLPAYAARESAGGRPTEAALQLVERVRHSGGCAAFVPSLDRLSETLETEGRPGDVVVLMGAGSIERIADEFTVRLRRHHAG